MISLTSSRNGKWLCRTKALDPISSLGYNDELHRNALLEMLPEPLSDHVCDDDDTYPSYRLLKKYVSRQVMLRAHINGKKGPVHNADQQGDGNQDEPQPENPPGLSEEEWGAVMALRKGKGKGKCACWSCGEQGHRAFECPRGAAGGKAAGPKGGKAGGGQGERKRNVRQLRRDIRRRKGDQEERDCRDGAGPA